VAVIDENTRYSLKMVMTIVSVAVIIAGIGAMAKSNNTDIKVLEVQQKKLVEAMIKQTAAFEWIKKALKNKQPKGKK